jgi:hypothetical protein
LCGQTPARHPDGDARLLHGPGLELRVADGVVRPGVAERLAAPETHQHIEALVEHGRMERIVGRLAEGRELGAAVRADADAEDQPAVAQVVERHGLAGELGGPPAGQRRHEGPELDPAGHHGHGRQFNPRIGDRHAPRRADVIPEEEAVPAGVLGFARQIGDDADVGEVAEVRRIDSKAHAGAPFAGGAAGRRSAQAARGQRARKRARRHCISAAPGLLMGRWADFPARAG